MPKHGPLAFQRLLSRAIKNGKKLENIKSRRIGLVQSAILTKWLVTGLIVCYNHSWQPASVAWLPTPIAAALRIGIEHCNASA